MPKKRTTETDIVVSGAAAARRKTTAAKPRAKRTVKPVEIPVEVVSVTPSPAEIAALAYSYWEARACQGGSAEEDWLRAEEALRTRACAAAV